MVIKDLGAKGGHARAMKLTPERRQEIAVNAANIRWNKSKGIHKDLNEERN